VIYIKFQQKNKNLKTLILEFWGFGFLKNLKKRSFFRSHFPALVSSYFSLTSTSSVAFIIHFVWHCVCTESANDYRYGCKKKSPTDKCLKGCTNRKAKGVIECVCTEKLCNNEKQSWKDKCTAGPGESQLNVGEEDSDSAGAVMIVADAMLMFISFIISQLL